METKMKFTEPRIKNLPPAPPGVKRAYYKDSGTRGLYVAVSPQGRKLFLVYRRVAGRPERIPIGLWPDLRVEQARKQAEKLNGAIAEGRNPAEERRQKRMEDSFGSLFEMYLTEHARPKKRPRSVAEDEANYRRYLFGWKDKKISAITRYDVQRLHRKLGKEHGVYAANRALALLSTAYNTAIKAGWQGVNPCKGIEKFDEESRERFLTQDEMPKFLKALSEDRDINFRDYVLLSLLTGARKGNMLAMRWEHIDFEGAMWTIPAGESKGKKALHVPLAVPAWKILKARREIVDGEWVFPSNVLPGQHMKEFRNQWEGLLKRAEIENLRLHDVRRTLGSWMSKSAALPVVKAALGHADIATTQIYARSENPEVRKAFEVTAKRMLEASNAETAKA